MKLPFVLPNGTTIDLLGDGPNDMEYICSVCGEYDDSISDLLEDYKNETNKHRHLRISDEIRDQAYFFAGEIANYDEDLQQLIEWDVLAEQIYHALINFVDNESTY